MTYSVIFSGADDMDSPEVFDLCPTGAWGAFRKWAEQQGEAFPALAELANAGTVEGSDAVSAELEVGADYAPDALSGLMSRMAELVGEGHEGETVTVADDIDDDAPEVTQSPETAPEKFAKQPDVPPINITVKVEPGATATRSIAIHRNAKGQVTGATESVTPEPKS